MPLGLPHFPGATLITPPLPPLPPLPFPGVGVEAPVLVVVVDGLREQDFERERLTRECGERLRGPPRARGRLSPNPASTRRAAKERSIMRLLVNIN